MKQALKGILSAETTDGKQLEMSIVEKESDLGFSSNKRLFVLINGAKFGYFSKYDINSNPAHIDISLMKA